MNRFEFVLNLNKNILGSVCFFGKSWCQDCGDESTSFNVVFLKRLKEIVVYGYNNKINIFDYYFALIFDKILASCVLKAQFEFGLSFV